MRTVDAHTAAAGLVKPAPHAGTGESQTGVSSLAWKERQHGRVFFFTGLLVFVLWGAYFIYRTSTVGIDGKRYFSLFEDAMISMRYAWNLSHGNGLVWNVGECVEGYTNPLMVLLMSVGTLLFEKSIAVLFVQAAGIVSCLVACLLTVRLIRLVAASSGLTNPAPVGWLGGLLLLCYYPFAYWPLMGMESGMLSCWLLVSVLLAIEYSRTSRTRTTILLATTLGAAYLTRPEALLAAIPILTFMLTGSKDSGRRVNKRYVLIAAGILLCVVLMHVAFRWWYYGELLPNSYYLKLTGLPLLTRIRLGARFILPFLSEIWVWLVLAVLTVTLDFSRVKLLAFSLFALQGVYQVWVGGDVWNYWRMMVPYVPFLWSLATVEVFRILNTREDSRPLREYIRRMPPFTAFRPALVLASILIVCVLLTAQARFLPEQLCLENPYDVHINGKQIDVAIALQNVLAPEASIGVLRAGTVPYYLENRAIDFFGKMDPHIARLTVDMSSWGPWYVPGHNKYDLDYSIKQLRPTYIQSTKWGIQDLSAWAKDVYGTYEYQGIRLTLRRDSPDVHWSQLTPTM